MQAPYRALLRNYTGESKLPLWVEHIVLGRHTERLFHDHNFTEIALILNGGGIHVAGAFKASIKAGDVIALHPGVTHAYDNLKDFELVNILYDPRKLSMPLLDGRSMTLFQTLFPEGRPSAETDMAKPILHLEPSDMEEIFQLTKSLETEIKGVLPGNAYRSMALFMDIAVRLARHGDCATPGRRLRFLIGEAVGFMNANFTRKISIDELVKNSKMSKRSFFRQFKLACGCTPWERLQDLRLRKAAELLLATDNGLNEIALDCGLCDGNYLCRKFRERYKKTPREFRLSRKER